MCSTTAKNPLQVKSKPKGNKTGLRRKTTRNTEKIKKLFLKADRHHQANSTI
jgi:osmotically-inducible protein OsmY